MEEFGILSLIPPIVAIILALTTKDVIISLVSSVAAGALVLAHFNPHGAFVIFWKDLFFTELTVNSWNGELIILVTIIGGFVEILDRSGGARAFGTLAHKVVNNRLKAQLVTWFGGLLIFFSDSANSLILGPIFRPIYDIDGFFADTENFRYFHNGIASFFRVGFKAVCIYLSHRGPPFFGGWGKEPVMSSQIYYTDFPHYHQQVNYIRF